MCACSPFLSSLAVGFATFLILAGTSPMLPLVWDEGELIGRDAAVKSWGEQVVGGLSISNQTTQSNQTEDEASPFSRETILRHWKSTTVAEGHPGGYLAVIAAGKKIAECCPTISPKTAWRFGPILLMSLALAVVFSTLRCHFGTVAALFSVMTVLLMPHVFAHAHFATCDGVLIAAWLLAFATFPVGHVFFSYHEGTKKHEEFYHKEHKVFHKRPKGKVFFVNVVQYLVTFVVRKSGVIWGICLGLTLAAKFTGFACLLPFLITIAFRLVWNRKSGDPQPVFWPYCVGGIVAVAVFYLLNPPLWHAPFAGFAEFLRLNLHRDHFNVSILFWGRMYDLHHSLPWYNTIVWVMISVPVLFLAMLPLGVREIFCNKKTNEQEAANRKTFGILLILNAVVLLVVRALPGTPPHDGTRLFIAAFPFLAIISGVGTARLWQCRTEMRRLWLRRTFVVLIFLAGLSNMILYAPQWLSFYNILIGGVARAEKIGFEPTYYWDALDTEVILWLNAQTGPDEKIRFSAKSPKTMDLVREWDGLQPCFRPGSPGMERWYVMQLRWGAMSSADWQLYENVVPVYQKTIQYGHNIPFWTTDTPILTIYDAAEKQK